MRARAVAPGVPVADEELVRRAGRSAVLAFLVERSLVAGEVRAVDEDAVEKTRCRPSGDRRKPSTSSGRWVTWTGSPPHALAARRQTWEEPERVERK